MGTLKGINSDLVSNSSDDWILKNNILFQKGLDLEPDKNYLQAQLKHIRSISNWISFISLLDLVFLEMLF